MHIFFIPSWYPHRREPTSGIFQRDQALAIAEMRPDWRVTIFDWGQSELALPLSMPGKWPALVRDFARHGPPGSSSIEANLVELREPVLTWSHRVARGHVTAVTRAAVRALARAERDFGPVDLVHAHVAFPAGCVAMELGRPYVITEHMGPFPFPQFVRSAALVDYVRDPLRAARVRMAVSTALARAIERHDVGPVSVVPNVVDERFFTPAVSQAETRTALFIGRLEPEKGVPELLEAASLVAPPFELRLGGTGPAKRDARSGVTWLGSLSRDQVRAELQRASCVVLPSKHESFGVVLVEAIACGTPIIATRCGGPEDIVTDDNGLLVPVGDVQALATALTSVMERSWDRERIRADFLSRFSRPVVVDQLERHYVDALAAGSLCP